jgi:probable rRNA maturation factor
VVKIIIKNFQNKIPISPKRIKITILEALDSESVKESGDITVCLVNDKKIKELNRKYLQRNNPTDVLAFNLTGRRSSGKIFADIVVSTDTAIRNAKIFKTNPLYEVYLYIIHGLLHILGYGDKNTKQRKMMQEKADNIIKKLNI